MRYLILVLFLAGCGGGECDKACQDEYPSQTVQPVHCGLECSK